MPEATVEVRFRMQVAQYERLVQEAQALSVNSYVHALVLRWLDEGGASPKAPVEPVKAPVETVNRPATVNTAQTQRCPHPRGMIVSKKGQRQCLVCRAVLA